MNSKKMLFFGEYFSRYIKTVLEFVMERWIVLSDFISRDFEKEWSMFNMSIVCASQISVDKVHVRYIDFFPYNNPIHRVFGYICSKTWDVILQIYDIILQSKIQR